MSPVHLELVMKHRGYVCNSGRPLRYLELGIGQGLSLAMHAATCSGEYYGNDFMPAHIAQAREFMAASGVNASLMEDSFEELAQRDDIPEFDVISMQGVWSWTSQRNREVIVDLIRRKLVAGGVV